MPVKHSPGFVTSFWTAVVFLSRSLSWLHRCVYALEKVWATHAVCWLRWAYFKALKQNAPPSHLFTWPHSQAMQNFYIVILGIKPDERLRLVAFTLNLSALKVLKGSDKVLYVSHQTAAPDMPSIIHSVTVYKCGRLQAFSNSVQLKTFRPWHFIRCLLWFPGNGVNSYSDGPCQESECTSEFRYCQHWFVTLGW